MTDAGEAARRAFWTRSMDDARRFMFEQVLPYPVAECGEPLVALPQAASVAGVEVLFSQAPHVEGLPRLFYLRAGQIAGFVGAAREMNARGWTLRVEDALRSDAMQRGLAHWPAVFDAVLARVRWELGGALPDPDFMFRRVSALVATVPKFGTHLSGSAIDVSVVHRDEPTREVDRGAPYLEMSELTPMDSPFVPEAARRNRREITALMARHGFVGYPWEFWHYSSGDAYEQVLRKTGRPAIYGAVRRDPWTGTISPFPDPQVPLVSEAQIRALIDAALARSGDAGWRA